MAKKVKLKNIVETGTADYLYPVNSTNEIEDFSITTPADGQALLYDATNSKWVNKDNKIENESSDEVRKLTIGDKNIRLGLTPTDKLTVNNRSMTVQSKLTAGDNITISTDETNTISATDTVTTATTTGTGNAVTEITATDGALTVTKGETFALKNKSIFDESMIDLGTVTSDIVIDTTTANTFKLTVGGNIDISLSSNITTGATKTVSLLLVGAGDYTITWDNTNHTIRWSDDTAPTFTSGKMDLITFITYDGWNWFSTNLDKLTESDITKPWIWVPGQYQTSTVGGRKFQRHPSGMGTVMSMNDGTDRNILVLDAQYRTNDKAYYDDWNTDLNSSGDPLDLCINTGYFSGSSISLPCTGFSDTTLNGSYSTICNQDTKNSKYNTDKLVTFNATKAEAASYCRGITVNGTGCDLPNINVLIRIFCEMTMLDSLDPTVSSYSDYALSSWSFGGGYYCWSSSWYGLFGLYCRALPLYYRGLADSSGQDLTGGVCPVLEI